MKLVIKGNQANEEKAFLESQSITRKDRKAKEIRIGRKFDQIPRNRKKSQKKRVYEKRKTILKN